MTEMTEKDQRGEGRKQRRQHAGGPHGAENAEDPPVDHGNAHGDADAEKGPALPMRNEKGMAMKTITSDEKGKA